MTPPSLTDLPPGFVDRILGQRTEELALRGLAPDTTAVAGDHLVFRAGTRLYGLRPALVETVMRTGFHPVPLLRAPAVPAVRGVFNRGGLLWSLVELTRLLQLPDEEEPGTGGKMLLLRGSAPRVALRVDHVLGVLTLRVADSAGEPEPLALLPPGSPNAGADPLVLLLAPRRLQDALARLGSHDAPHIPTDPIGA